ncbi:hypothetical protein HUJ04_010319 [Dendroctonus ponderosae]|nr:hypothetical protein HUJ04_010319 [Dendroctonus ponderosae]
MWCVNRVATGKRESERRGSLSVSRRRDVRRFSLSKALTGGKRRDAAAAVAVAVAAATAPQHRSCSAIRFFRFDRHLLGFYATQLYELLSTNFHSHSNGFFGKRANGLGKLIIEAKPMSNDQEERLPRVGCNKPRPSLHHSLAAQDREELRTKIRAVETRCHHTLSRLRGTGAEKVTVKAEKANRAAAPILWGCCSGDGDGSGGIASLSPGQVLRESNTLASRSLCIAPTLMAPRRPNGMDNIVGIEGYTRCCVPSGDCLRVQQRIGSHPVEDPMAIALDDLRDTVRVSRHNVSSSRLPDPDMPFFIIPLQSGAAQFSTPSAHDPLGNLVKKHTWSRQNCSFKIFKIFTEPTFATTIDLKMQYSKLKQVIISACTSMGRSNTLASRSLCIAPTLMAPRRPNGMDNIVGIEGYTRCCVPSGDCLRVQQRIGSHPVEDPMAIALDDLRDTVRVSRHNVSSSRLPDPDMPFFIIPLQSGAAQFSTPSAHDPLGNLVKKHTWDRQKCSFKIFTIFTEPTFATTIDLKMQYFKLKQVIISACTSMGRSLVSFKLVNF